MATSNSEKSKTSDESDEDSKMLDADKEKMASDSANSDNEAMYHSSNDESETVFQSAVADEEGMSNFSDQGLETVFKVAAAVDEDMSDSSDGEEISKSVFDTGKALCPNDGKVIDSGDSSNKEEFLKEMTSKLTGHSCKLSHNNEEMTDKSPASQPLPLSQIQQVALPAGMFNHPMICLQVSSQVTFTQVVSEKSWSYYCANPLLLNGASHWPQKEWR